MAARIFVLTIAMRAITLSLLHATTSQLAFAGKSETRKRLENVLQPLFASDNLAVINEKSDIADEIVPGHGYGLVPSHEGWSDREENRIDSVENSDVTLNDGGGNIYGENEQSFLSDMLSVQMLVSFLCGAFFTVMLSDLFTDDQVDPTFPYY